MADRTKDRTLTDEERAVLDAALSHYLSSLHPLTPKSESSALAPLLRRQIGVLDDLGALLGAAARVRVTYDPVEYDAPDRDDEPDEGPEFGAWLPDDVDYGQLPGLTDAERGIATGDDAPQQASLPPADDEIPLDIEPTEDAG